MTVEYRLLSVDGDISCSRFDTYKEAVIKLKEWRDDWREVVKVEKVVPKFRLEVTCTDYENRGVVAHLEDGETEEGLDKIGRVLKTHLNACNKLCAKYAITEITE